jgi:hypothetical protein
MLIILNMVQWGNISTRIINRNNNKKHPNYSIAECDKTKMAAAKTANDMKEIFPCRYRGTILNSMVNLQNVLRLSKAPKGVPSVIPNVNKAKTAIGEIHIGRDGKQWKLVVGKRQGGKKWVQVKKSKKRK